mgnify:CR=1 FL=1
MSTLAFHIGELSFDLRHHFPPEESEGRHEAQLSRWFYCLVVSTVLYLMDLASQAVDLLSGLFNLSPIFSASFTESLVNLFLLIFGESVLPLLVNELLDLM